MALRISVLRKALGWSQSKLARETELNVSTVNQIELGRSTGYPVQLAKIAKALGLPEADKDSLLEEVAG